MTSVAEVLKTTFDSARSQLVVLEKGVQKLEKKAISSFGEFQAQLGEAPKRLEGAWDGLVARVRPALAFATREELRMLAEKIDALSARVDKIAHGRARKPAAS